jgi:topoisomerase-4 subunit B
MRLTPVVINGNGSVPEILTFYMGRNTQERRNYIMENLIVDTTP